MALPTASPHPLSPQVIGNAFVQQYYEVLHRSPELVYRFYQDSSNLSRPDTDGMMSLVTTMQAINDKIVSLDYKNYFAEIETVDSQSSYEDGVGVFILVTGCLTGGDHVRRKFTQAFFLAPQDKGGYFVLNDIFRFVDETQTREIHQMLANGTSDDASPTAPLIPPVPDQDLVQKCDAVDLATPIPEGGADKGEEVLDNPLENGGPAIEDKVVVDPAVNLSQSVALPVSKGTDSIAREDAPKKSYASIVKVMKGSTSPVPAYVPTKTKAPPANPDKPVILTTKPVPKPETPVPTGNNVPDSNSSNEAEGYSIYIRNLPENATIEQIRELFKEFGPIKYRGIQVRRYKIDPLCFGFVEFESLDSMQAAIEASPISIGGRKAYVEEKKTTTRYVNGVVTHSGSGIGGRGRFPPGRVGYRNDGIGGRDNLRGNQGYGRSEFRNQGEYTGGWNGGAPDRGGGGYQQRGPSNVNGRIGRPIEMHQTAIPA